MHDANEPRDPASLVDETLDEHRACMQLVADVEGCLDRRPDDPPRWIEDLRGKLVLLTDSLRKHFEGEQAGPMYRLLPTRKPRLADALARLEAEHAVMLGELDKILRKADELRSAEIFELRELNARVQLFVARIRRHEAAENELVIEAYWDDIGVGD